MTPCQRHRLFVLQIFSLLVSQGFGAKVPETNLTCYQCTRDDFSPCVRETLLPCPSNKDLCVTHISKDKDSGLKVKRECGLGPCRFELPLMNTGLGLDDCDRSRDSYFCLFCCKQNGCNNDGGASTIWTNGLLLTFAIFTCWIIF